MGYPMTYQRVLNRSRIADGDYSTPPSGWRVINTDASASALQMADYWRKGLEGAEAQFKSLCGDLRRLERDAIDEGAICKVISDRTGIDAETVAAVLKEFMAY